MRAAFLMAANDLRQRLRDRSFFLFGFLIPLGITFVFSLLLGPMTEGLPTAKLGLLDQDGSLVSAGMRTALSAAADAGVVSWQTVPDVATAERLVANGEVHAAIEVPAGFGAAVQARGADAAGAAARYVRVLASPDRYFAAQVASSVASAYVSRLRSAAWAVEALADAGRPVVPGLVLARVASTPDALALKSTATSDRQLKMVTFSAAGMAAFFVFFIVQLGVAGLLDEEREGTLSRLLAAPVSRTAILGGKVLSSVVIGVLSMVVLAVASSLLMGADWGDPVGALLLILALVAAAAGVLMLVSGLARTSEAAGNVQAIVAITLGVLGGTFIPLPQQGGLLEWLQRISPHYWFLRGMGDLAGGGVGAIGGDLLAILAFALVAGAFGWALLGRRLNR